MVETHELLALGQSTIAKQVSNNYNISLSYYSRWNIYLFTFLQKEIVIFFCKKHRCVKKGSKSREPAKEAGYIIAGIS